MSDCDHRRPCSICVDNSLELLKPAPGTGVGAYTPPCRDPPVGSYSGDSESRKNTKGEVPDWRGDLVGVPRPVKVRINPENPDRSLLNNPQDWVEIDLRTGEVFLISVDIEKSAPLYALYIARELASARRHSLFPMKLPLDREPPFRCTEINCVCQPFSPEDKRARLGFCDGYPFDYYPLSAIGQIFAPGSSSTATGTLIGKRTVLCAAHSTGVPKGALLFGAPIVPSPSAWFRARADNTQSLTVAPFGAVRAVRVWVPLGWVWPLAAFQSSQQVNPYDIALFQLDVPKSDPIPMGAKTGRMLAAYVTDKKKFESYQFYMLGYPLCSSLIHRPLCCPTLPDPADNNAALWGDTSPGSFVEYRFPNLDFDPEVRISNFGTFGMSGSALFTYESSWAPGVPVALGIFSSLEGGPELKERWCTRITPAYAIQMANFIALYDDYVPPNEELP